MPDVPLTARSQGQRRWMTRLSILGPIAALLVASLWIWRQPVAKFLRGAGGKETPEGIIVARERIERFTRLTTTNLGRRVFPDRDVPKGALIDRDKVLGRVIKRELHPGEPVLEHDLAPPDSADGIEAALKKGWGTLTLDTNRVSGPIEELKYGSLVRILATWDTPGRISQRPTIVVCQKAEVLIPAPGADARTQYGQRRLTLQLPNQDLLRVADAMHLAKLALVLRPDDQDVPEPAGNHTAPPSVVDDGIEIILGTRRIRHEANRAVPTRPVDQEENDP